MNYLRSALGPVPQTEPLPGQVANSAGGYSFGVDDWTRLDRFLILGSEGGSYYATERKLTKENAQAVLRCIAADGLEVVKRLVAVSDAGRAPKNDPAIFALALCMKAESAATRAAAQAAVPKVCRIGTHLMHLAAFVNELGGWGRGTKRAFAQWYTGKSASDLGYQLVKYQSRDGWANRDILRLAHPKAPTVDHAALFAWATGKDDVDLTTVPPVVQMFESFKVSGLLKDIPTPGELQWVRDTGFPREGLPTEWLKRTDVWEALLPKMGLTALIRNLATMTRIGLISTGSEAASLVASRITDGEALRKSRVHPLAVLQALKTYQSGRSEKGSSTWTPVPRVVDALDAAFYASFGNVERTGKRFLLALDVSGSMSSLIAGSSLSAREASTAMAMVTAAVEPKCDIMCFSNGFVPCDLSPRRRLDDNIRATRWLGGGTDCSVPFLHALKYQQDYDAFVVYTDSETYAGISHPSACLKKYRQVRVPGAKSAVVGMVSNGFTLADPNDAGMLDVVGFDTATPNVMAAFFGG
jgi:60 kDa SS-A/Ro ribonucleoprotein